ncbi:MAG: hypothetical protein V3V99_11270 [candidate division Zixibacteria bacterium]
MNQDGVVEIMDNTILNRIDQVLKDNRRTETCLIWLAIILFLCGIAGIVTALVRGEFAWSIPSAFTSAFIYYPLRRIERIRRKNIALATAPALIDKLPTDKAAEELQNLIHSLYGDE